MKVRIKAIACSLWFGLIPWQLYEKQRHFNGSWLEHLRINVQYAWRWATFRETINDREFEKRINENY